MSTTNNASFRMIAFSAFAAVAAASQGAFEEPLDLPDLAGFLKAAQTQPETTREHYDWAKHSLLRVQELENRLGVSPSIQDVCSNFELDYNQYLEECETDRQKGCTLKAIEVFKNVFEGLLNKLGDALCSKAPLENRDICFSQIQQ